jgi:hypothetical protein
VHRATFSESLCAFLHCNFFFQHPPTGPSALSLLQEPTPVSVGTSCCHRTLVSFSGFNQVSICLNLQSLHHSPSMGTWAQKWLEFSRKWSLSWSGAFLALPCPQLLSHRTTITTALLQLVCCPDPSCSRFTVTSSWPCHLCCNFLSPWCHHCDFLVMGVTARWGHRDHQWIVWSRVYLVRDKLPSTPVLRFRKGCAFKFLRCSSHNLSCFNFSLFTSFLTGNPILDQRLRCGFWKPVSQFPALWRWEFLTHHKLASQ